jgi:hypothetical protein
MKTLLLALTILTLSFTLGKADYAIPTQLGLGSISSFTSSHRDSLQAMPKLTIATLRETTSSSLATSAAEFAQLGTGRMPISSGTALTLVAVLVIGLRLMGLNHARAMADHERDSYHGKAQMFRSLHEERSDRR